MRRPIHADARAACSLKKAVIYGRQHNTSAVPGVEGTHQQCFPALWEAAAAGALGGPEALLSGKPAMRAAGAAAGGEAQYNEQQQWLPRLRRRQAPPEDSSMGATDVNPGLEAGADALKNACRAIWQSQQEGVVRLARSDRVGKPHGGAGITLQQLIEEGILEPGENVLSVENRSAMKYATLMPDGHIAYSVSSHPWTPCQGAIPKDTIPFG